MRWSDIKFDTEQIIWREDADRAGRRGDVPLTEAVAKILRSLPSRGVGDALVFPSAEDPTKPIPFHTFQTWLRRAKQSWLDSVDNEEERYRLREALYGVGYHAEKRAAVRDPRFRKLSPKAQEKFTGTNCETLKNVYDEMSSDDLREELRQVGLVS